MNVDDTGGFVSVALDQFAVWTEGQLLKSYPSRLNSFSNNPLLSSLIISGAIGLVNVALAIIFGIWADTGAKDLTEDWFFFSSLVFMSIIFYYYLRLPRHLRNALEKLVANDIFSLDQLELSSDPSKLFLSFRRVLFPYTFALLGAVLTGVIILLPGERTWANANLFTVIVVVLSWTLVFFSIGGIITNIVFSVALLDNLFTQNNIKVHALHPDKSGGFASLGSFSFRLTIPALAIGLVLAFVAISTVVTDRKAAAIFPLSVIGFIYIIITPTLFFLPILKAHKAMRDFRDRLIQKTSTIYSTKHIGLLSGEDFDLEALVDEINYLNALKELQQHQLYYPVWPFSTSIGIGVIFNALLPLALPIAIEGATAVF